MHRSSPQPLLWRRRDGPSGSSSSLRSRRRSGFTWGRMMYCRKRELLWPWEGGGQEVLQALYFYACDGDVRILAREFRARTERPFFSSHLGTVEGRSRGWHSRESLPRSRRSTLFAPNVPTRAFAPSALRSGPGAPWLIHAVHPPRCRLLPVPAPPAVVAGVFLIIFTTVLAATPIFPTRCHRLGKNLEFGKFSMGGSRVHDL